MGRATKVDVNPEMRGISLIIYPCAPGSEESVILGDHGDVVVGEHDRHIAEVIEDDSD